MMALFSRGNGMPEHAFHNGGWYDTATLIEDTWVALAGMAWGGYQLYGRGAMVIGQNDDVEYFSAAMPMLAASRERVASKFRRDCASYHPEREFVVLLSGARDEKALRNGKIDNFCAIVRPQRRDMPTPPLAHAMLRAWEEEESRRENAMDAASI